MKQVHIIKANGEEELFDPSKLERSLSRAGASKDAQERVLRHITDGLREGMTTQEIYTHAYEILQKDEERPIAARYSIKRAIFNLGPSGYPFEQFVAEILKVKGWSTRTGEALSGKCVSHEVDVLAIKEGKRVAIEAKFHNSAGVKTDVKDTLYVHARFEDLKNVRGNGDEIVDEGWLITNTRFSRNAIRYGQCVNLTMFGWDYPRDGGIQAMTEETRVHPLTCLTTLSEEEKRSFLQKNIVLCKSITSGEHVLREHGVSPKRIPDILDEARRLCTS